MAEHRLHRVLSAVVKIKPGEARIALLLFAYFFLITAPYNIIKSLRDASYLEELGPASLPYAYASAVLVGLAVSLQARLQSRLSRRGLLLSSLGFFIVTDLAFWALFMRVFWPPLAIIFWMWANVLVVTLTTQFWILVNDIFNPREAKRLIGFFGSGGILGGVAGGLLTGFLAKRIDPHHLLLASAFFLGICVAVIGRLFAWRRTQKDEAGAARPVEEPRGPQTSRFGFWDCFRSVRTSRYLVLIAAVVFTTGIVSTLIDWQSKTIIFNSGKTNLASFFGFFNSGLLVFAFLFQLVLTSRFIERFGLGLGLMIYPAILCLFAFGIAVHPTLLFAIGIKGSDKALSYSINQSARELLYIPVLPELKYRAKIFIDMFLNRFAKAAGGLVLLILFLLAGWRPLASVASDPVVLASAAAGGLIIVWIVLNISISRAYVREVRVQLAKKWERPDSWVSERMDVETAKLIVDALESRTQSPTLFALHLYDLARRKKLTPEIKALLALSPPETTSSLSNPLMEGEEMVMVPDFDDLMPSADMDREIREILSLENYQTLMGDYAGRVLEGRNGGAETPRMELAKAIGLMESGSPLAAKLEDLLSDRSPTVFQFAAESAGKLRGRSCVPLLVRRLADPMSRGDARAALEKYGESIVGTLSDFLADRDESPALRGPAASLLAGIGTQEAADALCEELARGRSDLDSDIIDALDRIRSKKPDIEFPGDVVRGRLAQDIERLGPLKGLSGLLLLFKLLGLVYDHEDVFRAYQNLLKGTKDSVGYAIELLDQTLALEIKERLFPRLESLVGTGERP